MSEIAVVGNITRMELRSTQSGLSVLTMGLAINRYKGPDKEQETDFVDVTAWRELAEHVNDSLDKGARVLVIGRIQQQSWTTESGDKRSKIQILADEIGPSLRWATADVHKISKGEGGARQPKASTGEGETYDPNEEPF